MFSDPHSSATETQVFWDMTLCRWVNGLIFGRIMVPSSSRVKESKKNVSMTLMLKTTLSFKTSRTAHPVTQYYSLEDLSFQLTASLS